MFKFMLKSSDNLKCVYNVFMNALLKRGKFKHAVARVFNYSRPHKTHSKHLTWLTPLSLWSLIRIQRLSNPITSESKKDKIAIDNLITEADDLFNENRYTTLYDLLSPYKDCDDVEILWRLSRVMYNMSKQESSKEEKKQLIYEGFELIKGALKLNDTHFAVHKWYAIFLDARAAYDGIKARVMELENVKHHMVRAIELNPKDATTFHMLGFWCFNISAMPWYQRQIASAIFATPPTSTFEEALYYFVKAEEVDPNFYSQNLLMLGKTYIKLKKEEKARFYLKLASVYPARNDDDLQAKKEASELLKTVEK